MPVVACGRIVRLVPDVTVALFVAPDSMESTQFLAAQFRDMGLRCMAFSSITVACTWLGVELAHAMDVLRTILFDDELAAVADSEAGAQPPP